MPGDDHLDVFDPLDELRRAQAPVAAGAEVAAHARAQRLRLADVEQLAAVVAEEVDAGLRRQGSELRAELVPHDG